MSDRPYGENVKIVVIPISRKLIGLEATFIQNDKAEQERFKRSFEEEQTECRQELQTYLDIGYKLISAVPIESGHDSCVVYTLYDDGSD